MRTVGFFTDTTLCIGCKACEVACKEWNQLPDDGFQFTGMSYDNTVALGASTWRHVSFVERSGAKGSIAWQMLSDVCKHCERAGCLEACPTGAILRTEHGSIFIQPDICNGCCACGADPEGPGTGCADAVAVPGGGPPGNTTTRVPTFTRSNRSETSSFSMPMQPDETNLPIVEGWLVPWMR